MIGQVLEASPELPYLALRLVLDPSIVTSVLVESGIGQRGGDGDVKAVDVSALDADLLDATVRLVRLIDTPGAYRALAPLVAREITYRLLAGAQGSRLHYLATRGGHAHRIVRAVEKLRENFDKPMRIEDVARELGMSVSGFHAHFKTVTAMSPLRFQKQLRDFDAAEAGYRVGYQDTSHSAATTSGTLATRRCGTSPGYENWPVRPPTLTIGTHPISERVRVQGSNAFVARFGPPDHTDDYPERNRVAGPLCGTTHL